MTHNYTKHPEFNGIDEHVWNYLNDIGQSIFTIQKNEGRKIIGHSNNLAQAENPIWHAKLELDNYVARNLNITPDDYSTDMSSNPFYKASLAHLYHILAGHLPKL